MTEEIRDLTNVMRRLVQLLERPANPLTLNQKQAAREYGVHPNTIAKYIRDGALPVDEDGRISRKALEHFANRSFEQ